MLVGMQVGAATMEKSMEVPQKTTNRIALWLNNLTPGHISRKNKDTCSPSSWHCSRYPRHGHNKVSIDRGMGKEGVGQKHSGILLSRKKEWNNATCSNEDGPRDCHTLWSYMWNLKYDTMNIPMKPKQNHRQRENRPVVADGDNWGRDGAGGWG